MIYFNFYLLI